MNLYLKYTGLLILITQVAWLISCVEEIPIESDGFEDAIVIEATVTDQVMRQQVKLSQSFSIDADGPEPLSGADIKITGEEEYIFEESEPGIYISKEPFGAQPGISYSLMVSINGKEYESLPTKLTGTGSIGELKARRIQYQGEDGVAITLNNETSTGAANYYRYEFTETFKFNANYFKVSDIAIIDGLPVEVPKQKEEYTCYRTEDSNKFVLANTNSLSENSVTDLLIAFIDGDDPKLSKRYSILVKQYVISREAYTYYELLEELSGSDNVFSQNQPGFFSGNIANINDPEEKVIGYFDISNVSVKRLYFNYEDFYDPEGIRPRFVAYANCEVTLPDISTLMTQIEQGAVRWSETQVPENSVRPFYVVPTPCVDCTLFGTNIKPDFWED